MISFRGDKNVNSEYGFHYERREISRMNNSLFGASNCLVEGYLSRG